MGGGAMAGGGLVGGAGGGGGGDCCGGAGDACGGGYAQSTMAFLGSGAGDYAQETTYKYVGRGAGEFGVVSIPARRNIVCIVIAPLLLLIPLLWFLLQPETNVTTTTALPDLPTTTQTCVGNPATWPLGERLQCCATRGLGCPLTTAAPDFPSTTTQCKFDCMAGYDDLGPHQWVKGWSGEKKLFCCRTAHRGCPSELPPPSGLPPSNAPPEPEKGPFDCVAGFHNCIPCLRRQWSPMKIRWCCDRKGVGCEAL